MSDDDDFMQASDDEGYVKPQPFSQDVLMLLGTILSTKKTMRKRLEMLTSKTNTIMQSK
jgi:hypothetical protein